MQGVGRSVKQLPGAEGPAWLQRMQGCSSWLLHDRMWSEVHLEIITAKRQGPKMAKRLKKTALPRPKQRKGAPRSRVSSLQGRETEVALIEQLLERIDQGGSTLVIGGAAGIGKSAL